MFAACLDHWQPNDKVCGARRRSARHAGSEATFEETTMAVDGRRPDTGPLTAAKLDDHAALVARARALIPPLRDRAPRTEKLRRLPAETERDLHDAGLFRILDRKSVV